MIEPPLTEPGAPGEIVLPRPDALFQVRSQRFRTLQTDHPSLADYLGFLAALAEQQSQQAQARLSAGGVAPGWQTGVGLAPSDPSLPLAVSDLARSMARDLLSKTAPSPLSRALEPLLAASDREMGEWIEQWLRGRFRSERLGGLLMVGAALQVVWAIGAAQSPAAVPEGGSLGGDCPLCGGPPVVSLLENGSATHPGLRYLVCNRCSTLWNRPRLQCIQCGESSKLAYFALEERETGIEAEACAGCFSYLKMIDREKRPQADPFADDLASLPLDMLLDEQGYRRLGFNAYLLTTTELPEHDDGV